jgi:mannose-6-phosphate isomerase-like protein (cupin superfamily)
MSENKKVHYIPAKPSKRDKRVGIYCRVSSNSVNQLKSLTAQVSALTRLTAATPQWLLVDIYGYCLQYCYYGNTPYRNFELFLLEMDSGASYTSVGHSEKSQEYITVLEGELELSTNNEDYLLKTEDSICFLSAMLHTYKSCGKSTLKAMIVNFYPV